MQLIQSVIFILIDCITYLMKFGVMLSLPFLFIYYMCYPKKMQNKCRKIQ